MSKKVVNEKKSFMTFFIYENTKEKCLFSKRPQRDIGGIRMEYVMILFAFFIIIISLYFIFEINLKKIKKAGENSKLDKIVSRFPENKEICKSILKMLKNEKVKIKENDDKDNKTSLYIAISNTIFIANIKNSYTRIQTIAHECLHSIQNRRLLLFNFIYSNIYLLYFLLSIILTLINIYQNYYLQIIILTLMGFIYYGVRSYLETDAMTKAKYVAQDYINNEVIKNKVCTKKEKNEIIKEYEKINKIGIPATNYVLMVNCFVKVIIYIIIVLIFKNVL